MSILWPAEDMPWTESGLTPDILFNPHGTLVDSVFMHWYSCLNTCVYRPVMFATHDEVDRSFSGYAMVYMACGKSESQWLLTLNRTDGRCTAIPTLNLCFVSSGQVPENAMQLSFSLFPKWWFQNCPCKLSQTQPSWEKMIKLTCMMFHICLVRITILVSPQADHVVSTFLDQTSCFLRGVNHLKL